MLAPGDDVRDELACGDSDRHSGSAEPREPEESGHVGVEADDERTIRREGPETRDDHSGWGPATVVMTVSNAEKAQSAIG